MKTIWDNDFTDCEMLPLGLADSVGDNASLATDLEAAKKAMKPWAQGQEASSGEGRYVGSCGLRYLWFNKKISDLKRHVVLNWRYILL